MKEKRTNHILTVLGVLLIILGMIAPFYLTHAVGDVICNATTENGWCSPMLDLYVFFSIAIFFALIGIGLIFMALKVTGEKTSAQKKS